MRVEGFGFSPTSLERVMRLWVDVAEVDALHALEGRVRLALDEVRSVLGDIELQVQDEGERDDLMGYSRGLARFCMAAREFLFGMEGHRPLPRRFAEQVRAILADLPTLGEHAPPQLDGARRTLETLCHDAEHVREK